MYLRCRDANFASLRGMVQYLLRREASRLYGFMFADSGDAKHRVSTGLPLKIIVFN